jgi:ubiquinone/menaquinone biosynthesis C-methylase UbiE
MDERVCPVWVGYLLSNPLRKIFQSPSKIFQPYIKKDMIVLDLGSAMGFFSLPIAERVKPNGKVICVDMQEKMINVLNKKAQKAGLSHIIEGVICDQKSLKIEAYAGKVDFALAFAVLHEVPVQANFFQEINQALKADGKLLLSEPSGHVKKTDFEQSLYTAEENNFKVSKHINIHRSFSVLLEKIK